MRELGSKQPTAVELEILRILWEQGPCPVRIVHSELTEVKDTNYSTTVKMLSVMLRKGLVKRNDKVTPHLYRAAVTQKHVAKTYLTDLIEKVYDGSTMSLVLQALSQSKASPQEIAEARQLLDQLETDQ